MNISGPVKESEELASWLAKRIDGLNLPSQDRFRIAAGCFDMVLEHHVAVVILIKNSLFGSAAALLRSQFEAQIRGIWLLLCATDDDIELFKNDNLNRSFSDLIKDIEKIDAYSGSTYSYVKEKSWKVMNSFTHTGFYQVVRRNTAGEIRPDYKEEEILDAMSSANSFAILAGVEIAGMVKDENLTKEITNHGINYFNGAL